jgi:hypothetical protein
MTTQIVNRHKESFDIYIGRGTPFGNPFIIGVHGNREEVIAKYKQWFYMQLDNDYFKKQVLNLKDKTLGCSCKPLSCHGDVIVEYLDKED